ncbi:unnamed protein product [Cyprideis torosa]|uniref:Uncharacterized protein n=1 Tax=Cyprideis torosa TaxID=163714 RepID=A0A7R8ZFL5_9CRUS|nr:unnamed protein product [Cyprideis torosa]CAG0879403.1 unnamed protein product [Cyprideis torosa]
MWTAGTGVNIILNIKWILVEDAQKKKRCSTPLDTFRLGSPSAGYTGVFRNTEEGFIHGAWTEEVSATDLDTGLNGRLRYALTAGDPNRDFSIAEDSGIIRVAKAFEL